MRRLACFTTFVSASQATKYAVASICGAQPLAWPPTSSSTGSGARRASDSSACGEPTLREDPRVDAAARARAARRPRPGARRRRRRGAARPPGRRDPSSGAARLRSSSASATSRCCAPSWMIALDAAALLVRRAQAR